MTNGVSIRPLEGDFWDALTDYFTDNGIKLLIGNHYCKNDYRIAVGRTGFLLCFVINTVKKWLHCEIYINGEKAKKAFDLLENDKKDIENIIELKLCWQEDLPRGDGYRIFCHRDGDIIREKDNWEEYFKWFEEYGLAFREAFVERIKLLKL